MEKVEKKKGFSGAFKLAAVAALLVFCGAFAVLKMSAGTVKVAAAKEIIPPGAEVTAKNAGLVELPRRLVPDGAVTSLDELKGKRVSVARLPGDLITGACLTDRKVSQIPSGAAGFFVPLGPAEAGSLKPNDLVAVVTCPGAGSPGEVAGVFRVASVVQNKSDVGEAKAEALLYGDEQSVVRAAPWVKDGHFRLLIRGGM
ncbi:SAF domain-containing protein [Desulfofundulus thermosubterraneus DSM 16057]|uniref:SAF domain-containing protein n=2 Tax=Desulfofundulus TaxID=2282741 RepID=A0A1M6JB20_9FIRM|nr:SAF domain-containing protein [Desulfofundulus thermosubterraneus DSM 16057]